MIYADPSKPKGIVWLASYPKSGNTWLRMFLYQIQRIMGGHPREEDELNKLDRSSMYEARLFGLFNRILDKPVATATAQEVTRVRPLVHATVVDRVQGGAALVKTHNLLGKIGKFPILNLAVSAGAIYVVRDPRDVAPSLAKHLGSSIDEAIRVMAQHAYATQNNEEAAFETWGSWSEHVNSWTMDPSPQVLIVRYEDMMAEPTETFSGIIKHLRQNPTAEQITEAIELSSFDKLKRQEDSYDFRERSPRADRFFVSGRAGGWRETLSEAQVKAIVAEHSGMMRKFGYLD
jgi:hypothetical protein